MSPICNTVTEDVNHLFFSLVAQAVINKTLAWWDLDYHLFYLIQDLEDWFANVRMCKKAKDILEGVFFRGGIFGLLEIRSF